MLDREALTGWYRGEARSLPWRSEPTPYHVLLSELMCQQTRVETALPYFERFRTRWPTLEHLAAASEEEVLEAWAGLGYYSRARRLLEAARAAVARGGLPDEVDGLLALPGIGPYTAGAIASIAFGRPVEAVDGNVDRVLGRWHAVDEPVDAPAGKRRIRALAAALHADRSIVPGDLNQALMELGARVCKPRSPSCDLCPVRVGCAAAASGDPTAWPRKRPKKPARKITGVAGVLVGSEGPFLVRREGRGLLGGLWTPPVVLDTAPDDREALVRSFAAAGVVLDQTAPLADVRHVFSHRDLTARVYMVRGRRVGAPDSPWTDARFTRERNGMSRLGQRILEAFQDAEELPLLAADGGIH